jgi:hypothetical protein
LPHASERTRPDQKWNRWNWQGSLIQGNPYQKHQIAILNEKLQQLCHPCPYQTNIVFEFYTAQNPTTLSKTELN